MCKKSSSLYKIVIVFSFQFIFFLGFAQQPLPEHPRPDFQREEIINLNGYWDFEFDQDNRGLKENWAVNKTSFSEKILVPFPWGSKLSEIENQADIAWYHKKIILPTSWESQRPFLVIGASDWETSVYLDGKLLGKHQGGYTPFDFDLSAYELGVEHDLVIRVDDIRRDFTLYGKQGYGDAKGIWQTIYLEPRGLDYIQSFQINPDIDREVLKVKAILGNPASQNIPLRLSIQTKGDIANFQAIQQGQKTLDFEIPFPDGHLWTLEDPFLYDYSVELGEGNYKDSFKGYFGYRKISADFLPGTDISYVMLNNKPVYLKLALDQSYHPEGFYTFPTDDFMRNEILIAKKIGLNGIRTHIKVDVPRKLYWADKLGLFIMSDLPNSWGEPKGQMKVESEQTLRELIARDYNHPSIFSWIVFNEGWGLFSNVEENGKKTRKYLPETQKWVVEMVNLAKGLDPSRLVEDNSICCDFKHVDTDIHSWHSYLPGYEWDKFLQTQVDSTFAGSTWNFMPGYKQGNQPMINSEFGNVWGYNGSTGDVDITYDYHRSMNAFRNHLKIAGWLYTEHHDVINEWNGYVRFDRSPKYFGLSDIVPGMSIRDLHSDFYISTGQDISFEGFPGDTLSIPLKLSALTDVPSPKDLLIIKKEFYGTTAWGEKKNYWVKYDTIQWKPWTVSALPEEKIVYPEEKSINTLSFTIMSLNGKEYHKNFVSIIVQAGEEVPINDSYIFLSKNVGDYSNANFKIKTWKGVRGHKINGFGEGYFEFEFDIPKDLTVSKVECIDFIAEMSSKALLGKDKIGGEEMQGDYMLGKGTFDPGKNPNAYPQTDDSLNPAFIQVYGNDQLLDSFQIADDPADHNGILSWFYQKEDRTLDEAGTYGYLYQVPMNQAAIQQAIYTGKLKVKIQVIEGSPNGISIYGDHSGKYIINPTLKIKLKD